MKNLYDDFDRFYNTVKKEDEEIVESILKEIKKYDVFDIIAKLSALNLVPENQNKATIIEPIIATILTISREELTSKQKISIKKFKELIQLIENMRFTSAIDPPENPFIDRVMFYNNYNIFTGINYIPGYILQSIINTLYITGNQFNIEFSKRMSKLINFILVISDYISKEININIENLKKYNEISNIVIPSKNRLEKLEEYIIIKEDIVKYMINDNELINFLYSDFENENIENILNLDNQKFFKKPFLKDGKGNVIILSPSILVPFLIHSIVSFADRYGEKEKLIELYNKTVWKQCIRYLDKLGNKKINENSLNIELKKDDISYKEALLSGDNKQVIITIGVFDDGRNFNKEKVFDYYINNQVEKLLDERIDYITNKLKQKILEKNIFICLIYNSFGRSMLISFNKSIFNAPICLNPFELKCISINEREQKFFLTRYISAKNKLLKVPQFFGELPFIDVYTNCDYSFYISDEFNPNNTMLYLSGGDCIEYMIKSLKKEDRQLVESYDPKYMEEVILLDKKRKIYFSDRQIRNNIVVSLLVKMKNIEIWIYSEKAKDRYELQVYRSMIDAISYWIGECKKIVENKKVAKKRVNIKISMTGNGIEYFYNKEYNESIENTILIKNENNILLLNISPNTYYCFNRNDNQEEKNLILIILKEIINFREADYKNFERIFYPDKKQKFFTSNYDAYPYLEPIEFPQNRKINSNDINELLNDVGKYIISLKKWNYGIVNEENKNEITSLVVDYLYKLLQTKIKKLQPHSLVEVIYHDLEEKLYYMMMFQRRNYNDVLCYPEEKGKIWKDFNDSQRVSNAAKFLMEYVSAQPPSGEEVLGESEYEKLLAICSLIIEWAYTNDLFRFKIFDTPIEILNSDRIGIKKDEFNNMEKSMLNARVTEFEYNSIGKWNDFLVKDKFESEELDKAFEFEKGFTFTEFLRVCYNLILIGKAQENEIKKIECEKLITKINEQLKEVDESKVRKILNYISLEERDDFLKPPKEFRVEDVYPWRFNRELSFTRRPLVKRGNEYIWGNRNVFHMMMFTMDLINDGKFKAKSKEMKRYIGEISKNRGKAFNDSIFNILKNFHELVVDKNLKKINGKRIQDKENKDLGDIYILYIYDKNKQIVVGEVKDFKLSRNPYEIYCEYRGMFEDSVNKKSYSTKLKRRAEWVEEHIEDLKQQYGLCGDNWKVYKTFIVNEHLVSKDIYGKNENIIAISDISLRNLTHLK